MNIDITDAEIVKLIIQDIESPQNKERKKQEWEAYQCTQGLMRNYVFKKVQELFPKNYRKMRVSDVSLSKKVMDKVSKAYSQNPVRSLEDEVADETKEMLDDIYKDGCFNSAFREFDESFNLHRYSNFWVNYDPVEKEYRPQNLRPYEYDLVRDPNSGKVLCVILNYPDLEITRQNLYFGADLAITDGVNQLIAESQVDSGAESKVYALWTDTQHAVVVVTRKVLKDFAGNVQKVEYAVTYVPLKDNPQNVNPLGRLPFAYKQKGSSVDYPFHNQITEQSINYNLMMTDLITAASIQGFGQAILSYPDNAEIKDVEVGLWSAVRLPQSRKPDDPKTEFKFESPSPDLAGQKQICDNYMYSVLSEHGIEGGQSSDQGSTQNFTSAADRYMASADVQWIVKENQEVYQELEQEVFEIIKLWESLNGNNALDKAEELKVYFPQPTINITESDKLKNIEMLLKLRLKTRPQALMILDPNLSEAQAESEIEAVDEESVNSMKTFRNQIAGNDASKSDSNNNFGKQGSSDFPGDSSNSDASLGNKGSQNLN